MFGFNDSNTTTANYTNGTSSITAVSRTAPITIASGDAIHIFCQFRLAAWAA